ncbi:hypothetical protein KI659_13655 [Litoribacter alkaliphilus]|uniref:Uncharacterized protein n=1 Tax=Litoribacter ruber TaxID=702568 RepID=A0AAP2CM25_9BACT|nr:hypothetical protein [Litoribacter alkaliphilus]MBS9525060.1 hypothetical protein [Litoribacter alkaliphilus]
MSNRNKLIAANIFALFATIIMLMAGRTLEIEFGLAAENLTPAILLFLIPQLGFVFTWLTHRQVKGQESVNRG